MLKRRRGTVTAFQVAHFVLLSFALTFFHQEVLRTRDEGRVKVRPSSCSNTLDYRRGLHSSTPDCSPVGHVSTGTLKKKEKKTNRKRKNIIKKYIRSTFDISSSQDSKSQ